MILLLNCSIAQCDIFSQAQSSCETMEEKHEIFIFFWESYILDYQKVYYLHEVCQPAVIHTRSLLPTWSVPACCNPYQKSITYMKMCQPAVIHTRSLLPTWSVPACCNPYQKSITYMKCASVPACCNPYQKSITYMKVCQPAVIHTRSLLPTWKCASLLL